jgi:hypothetical protein
VLLLRKTSYIFDGGLIENKAVTNQVTAFFYLGLFSFLTILCPFNIGLSGKLESSVKVGRDIKKQSSPNYKS